MMGVSKESISKFLIFLPEEEIQKHVRLMQYQF